MFLALQQLPGPQFLIIFPLLVLVSVLFGRVLLWLLGDPRQKMPEPADLPPKAIAAMKGETPLLIKTVLFSLWHREIIEIKSSERDPDYHYVSRAAEGPAPKDKGEKLIYDFLDKTRNSGELLTIPSLCEQFSDWRTQLRDKCQQFGLIRSTQDKRLGVKLTGLVLLAAYGPGISKLVLGITRNRPFGWLIVEMIIALIVILMAMRTFRNLTPNGNRYLKNSLRHFAWMKREIEPTGIDPAYGMALFGIGVIGGGALFNDFRSAFPPPSNGGDSSSGCSSCSGGCSSGCGGGCGGCGGD